MKKLWLIAMFLALPVFCQAQEGKIAKQHIVNAAVGKVAQLGFKTDNMKMIYDQNNAMFRAYLQNKGVSVYNRKTRKWDPMPPSAPEERVPELAGKDYQVVYFQPKDKKKDGDIWVFVDRNTGKVIQWMAGK